jgi:hypothetical protein
MTSFSHSSLSLRLGALRGYPRVYQGLREVSFFEPTCSVCNELGADHDSAVSPVLNWRTMSFPWIKGTLNFVQWNKWTNLTQIVDISILTCP